MWPFTGMSLATATLIGSIANWTLLVCLLGGVLATFFIVQTTDIKEEHWAEDRRHSNEKIAELAAHGEVAKAELGKAQADIANAHAQSAEAQARTKEAEVKLAELRRLSGPRGIGNGEALKKALEGKKPPKATEVWYLRDVPDAQTLAFMIAGTLQAVGWGQVPVKTVPPIEPGSDADKAGISAVQAAGGLPTGVSVATSSLTGITYLAAYELASALGQAMGIPAGGTAGGNSVPEGELRIIIGPKHDPIFPDAWGSAADPAK